MADRIVAAEKADRTPDWRVWRLIREPELWQLVLLSLNIDPYRVKGRFPESWEFELPRFNESQDFHNRLYVVRENRGRDGVLAHPQSCMSFRIFAAWVHRFDWDAPAELLAMADEHDPGKQKTPTFAEGNANVEPRAHNKRNTVARNLSWQAQIDDLATKHQGTSHTELCRKLGRELAVNFQTIRRITTLEHG